MRSGPISAAGAKTAIAALVLAVGLAACGGGDDDDSDDSSSSSAAKGAPNPQPAYYLTAANSDDLKTQAYDAGAKFAESQGPGNVPLILDFGAARIQKGTHGVSLRSGTFFSNEDVGAALEEAAKGYSDHHKQGTMTLVYANTNALLAKAQGGYEAFDEASAREAGEEQAKTVAGLDLPSGQTASVGGDIEPGYDVVAKPELSIAMVAGANSVSKEPYYDVGTAPCKGNKCTNGWTPRDLCQVASGSGRTVLPEIYFDKLIDQPSQWAEIQKTCKIDRFAGVSASTIGTLSPAQSLDELRRSTSGKVPPVIVVWPG